MNVKNEIKERTSARQHSTMQSLLVDVVMKGELKSEDLELEEGPGEIKALGHGRGRPRAMPVSLG